MRNYFESIFSNLIFICGLPTAALEIENLTLISPRHLSQQHNFFLLLALPPQPTTHKISYSVLDTEKKICSRANHIMFMTLLRQACSNVWNLPCDNKIFITKGLNYTNNGNLLYWIYLRNLLVHSFRVAKVFSLCITTWISISLTISLAEERWSYGKEWKYYLKKRWGRIKRESNF